MIDEYKAVGGMRVDRGNSLIQQKVKIELHYVVTERITKKMNNYLLYFCSYIAQRCNGKQHIEQKALFTFSSAA
jgi:hypothetical protein